MSPLFCAEDSQAKVLSSLGTRMRFAHQDSSSTLKLPAAFGVLELIFKVLYFGHFSQDKSEPRKAEAT